MRTCWREKRNCLCWRTSLFMIQIQFHIQDLSAAWPGHCVLFCWPGPFICYLKASHPAWTSVSSSDLQEIALRARAFRRLAEECSASPGIPTTCRGLLCESGHSDDLQRSALRVRAFRRLAEECSASPGIPTTCCRGLLCESGHSDDLQRIALRVQAFRRLAEHSFCEPLCI